MVENDHSSSRKEEEEKSQPHLKEEEKKKYENLEEKQELIKGDEDRETEYDPLTGTQVELVEGADEDVDNHNESIAEVEEEKDKPPDGGYGWFIVLGCFISHFIIGGFERNDGIYFLEFRERFGESAQLTSWPGALVSALRLFLGPVAGALCTRFSARSTVMVGCVFLIASNLLDSISPNFFFLFFSHSLIQGLANALMYAPSLIIVNMYFDKHRGVAAGLGSSGVGVGTFVLIPFTQFLFEHYGFSGAFFILAGVASEGLLVAMLFRPLSLHRKFNRRERFSYSTQIPLVERTFEKQATELTVEPSSQVKISQSPYQKGKEETVSLSEVVIKKSKELESSKPCAKWPCLSSSLKIIFPIENKGKIKNSKANLFNFHLLKDPSFCMFCISIGLFTINFKAAFTFIPALVKSKGLSESQAALVLSITGIFDTIGRVAAGLILDRLCLRQMRPVIYTSLIFAIAAVSFILPFLTSFLSLVITCSFFGSLTGAYISQKSVVLVDILGIENMASSFGIMICFQGVGICLGPPLAGALRDEFGGFDEAFYLGGGFMVMAGILMIASNIFLKLKRSRQTQLPQDGKDG